jgi:hypothetical protein
LKPDASIPFAEQGWQLGDVAGDAPDYVRPIGCNLASVRLNGSGPKTVRAGRTLEHPKFNQEPDRHADQYQEANQASAFVFELKETSTSPIGSSIVRGIASTGPKLSSPAAIIDGT